MVKKNKVKKGVSNRLLYTLITIGILAILGIGVYAFGTNNPSSFGHSAGELSGVCLSNGTGCPSGLSQWIASGNNIYYNNGNVGIGTSNPTARLDVNGTINTNGFLFAKDITLPGNLYVQGVNPSSAAWIEAPLVLGNAAFDRGYIYFPRIDAQIIPYVGNKSLHIENYNGVVEVFSNKLLNSGGLILNQQGLSPKPTCNTGNRGMIWFTPSSSGEDLIEICRYHPPFDPSTGACGFGRVLGWIELNEECV